MTVISGEVYFHTSIVTVISGKIYFHTASSSSTLKTRTLFSACWVICLHNPANSDADCKIFNERVWSIDMLIHTEDLGKACKHEHIKPLLQKLHWLLVVSRIQYKIATLCYSSLTESYPVHLSELLTVYHPSRQLRSISDTRTIRILFTKTKTFGQRAFSFTGPTEWNSLLYDVRHSVSTSSFQQALKTHLFKSAYN